MSCGADTALVAQVVACIGWAHGGGVQEGMGGRGAGGVPDIVWASPTAEKPSGNLS